MDIRKVKKLIELVKETGVGELEIHEDKESVRISLHSPVSAPVMPAQVAVSAAAPLSAPSTSAIPPAPAPAAPAEEPQADMGDKHTVKSPMVGSAYLAPTPGAKPFIEIGQQVEVGDTLCLIEAMKMFNQIEADKAGKVTARLVENGSPVEFDQPLFIIE